MPHAKPQSDASAQPKPLFPLSPDAIRRLLGLDSVPPAAKAEAS